MKKIITILLLSFYTIFAQPYQINYSVIVENCNGTDNFQILSGTMTEGESFTFSDVIFPTDYANAQFLYNIFSGGEFGIPEGSLNENINLVLNMGQFWCNLGFIEDPIGVYKLFSLYVEITGETSGYNPLEYYWFNENKEAFIKLNLDKITPYSTLLGIDNPDDLAVFYVGEDQIDRNAIRKEIVGGNFIIYPQHFSLLSAGIVNETATNIENALNLPNDYNLNQNYPNPFNPTTTINYSIPVAGHVSLSIYDIIGNKVEILENGYKSAGNYSLTFEANELTSGLYFYTIQSGGFTKTNKMILLK